MTKIKFSEYNKCLEYLFNLERSGIKYDLRNIRSLLRFLNNPQNNFKSIHIAGTNGKGSVASVLNSFLIENKVKTGIYTSPHIKDFRERILINGKFISRKYIIDFVNRLYLQIEKIKPSFFEVTTAMAFEYFSHEKAEYAVIETGLGGRLDSTNILKPILTVITGVDIDHVSFLGKTIEKIAAEKAGIIKNNIPVVIGKLSPAAFNVIEKIAFEKNSEILRFDKRIPIEITQRTENGFYFNITEKQNKLFYPVIGDYQISNIKTSLKAISFLDENMNLSSSKKIIKDTFRNLKINSNFMGRFEMISKKPKIITDVSHNLQAIKNIKSNLKYFKYDTLIIIFGMMNDKDFSSCLKEIGKLKVKKIIVTKPEYRRAAVPEKLLSSVGRFKQKFIAKKNIADSLEYAMSISNNGDLILVTGSFFLVNDFLKEVAAKNEYLK